MYKSALKDWCHLYYGSEGLVFGVVDETWLGK